MTITFNPSGDLAYVDSEETVTVVRVKPDGTTDTTYTGVLAFRRDKKANLVSLGQQQIVLDRITWHLDAATIAVAPKRGDRIVDANSVNFLILTSNLQTRGTRYRCETQQII